MSNQHLTIIGKSAAIINFQLPWINYLLIALFGFFFSGASGQRPNRSKLKKWEARGDTLMARERYGEAIKTFTKIIDASSLKEKSDYTALYKRSICYFYDGEGSEALALADVNRYIVKFPNIKQPRVLRILIYRSKDNWRKQLEDLNFVLDLKPNDADMLKWRAGLWIDSGEYRKAKQDAEASIRLNDHPETETYLGFAHFTLKNPDSSLMAINRAIELDKTYMPAYLYGGSFCLQSDEFELALDYLNAGLLVEPENSSILFYKGIALVELDRKDEGCRCLNKAFYNGYDDAGDYIEQYCYTPQEH